MGFCMTCEHTGKNCGYTTWFEQRVSILLVTIKYLEDQINKIKMEFEDENAIQSKSEDDYESYKNRMDEYFEALNQHLIEPIKITNNTDRIYNILIDCVRYTGCKEALIHFLVYGIYLLCKESDCSGAYSVGESYDIVEMLEQIKPYFDETSNIYEVVYTIKSEFSNPILDIFRESITLKKPIRIT